MQIASLSSCSHTITLPAELQPLISALINAQFRPVVVGGYLRDALLNIPSKDIDIEVFGVADLEQLSEVLEHFGTLNSVGKSFGVLKMKFEGLELDFSIPRQEKKVAKGHKGFDVTLDSALSFKDAAKRRDFTINAMGYDLSEEVLLDPYHGIKDLENRVLDIVDAETFVEDPLRLYRAMQFAARFELKPSLRLMKLAQKMVQDRVLNELPKERVFEEFKKLFLKSRRPSLGFELMDAFGMLAHFSALKALQGVPQNPRYHPEGDVWVHTMMVIDAMAALHGDDEKENLILSLAALCHDLGKPATTKVVDGVIRAIGHENAGVGISEEFLESISDEKQLAAAVLPLVKHHLKPRQFYTQGAKSAAIRRLARVVNIRQLVLVAKADFLGRTTAEALRGDFKAGEWLLERAKDLNVQERALEPLIQGRDLISQGLKPSKAFKSILDAAYEAQMEGLFLTHDEALLWLHQSLKHSLPSEM